ncbi:hypothetical protein WDU94_009025 [Cyamophila willieti]
MKIFIFFSLMAVTISMDMALGKNDFGLDSQGLLRSVVGRAGANSCDWPDTGRPDNSTTRDANKAVHSIVTCLSFKFDLDGMRNNNTENAIHHYVRSDDIEGLLTYVEDCQHVDLTRANVDKLMQCGLLTLNW